MATKPKGGRPKITDEQRSADTRGRALLALLELYMRAPTVMLKYESQGVEIRREIASRLTAFNDGRVQSLDESFGVLRNRATSKAADKMLDHLDELLTRCAEYHDRGESPNFVAVARELQKSHGVTYTAEMVRDRWYDFRQFLEPAPEN